MSDRPLPGSGQSGKESLIEMSSANRPTPPTPPSPQDGPAAPAGRNSWVSGSSQQDGSTADAVVATDGSSGRAITLRDDQQTIISSRPPMSVDTLATTLSESVLRILQGRILPGDRLGQFELLQYVGGGGMGRVFRALDTRLARTVALKILSPDQASDHDMLLRFQNEAQSAARLDHDNIARVHYVGEDRGLHYIVFEFIDGVNIARPSGSQRPTAPGRGPQLYLAGGRGFVARREPQRRPSRHQALEPADYARRAGEVDRHGPGPAAAGQRGGRRSDRQRGNIGDVRLYFARAGPRPAQCRRAQRPVFAGLHVFLHVDRTAAFSRWDCPAEALATSGRSTAGCTRVSPGVARRRDAALAKDDGQGPAASLSRSGRDDRRSVGGRPRGGRAAVGTGGQDLERAATTSCFVSAAACALGRAAGCAFGHCPYDGLLLDALDQSGHAAAVAVAERIERYPFQFRRVHVLQKG